MSNLEEKKLDKVDKSELDGKYKDREDKDIDNDGDTDDSDRYLHKRRKAISKAIDKVKESLELDEAAQTSAVYKALSPGPGKSVSNRYMVKVFKDVNKRGEFLSKQTSNVWKTTDETGLKNGTYRINMVRGPDGKPKQQFIKESLR